MKLNAIGLNIRHIGDFCIDRPNGSGDNLLIVFKTNALLYTDDEEITVPPDSAILYSVGKKQLYKSVCRTYVNHFLHFTGAENECMDISLPFDKLIKLNNISSVEEILRMISREQISGSVHSEKYTDMLLKILLMKLSDGITDKSPDLHINHSAELELLRAEIYSNAGQYSSICQLAAKVNLSVSLFQQLYKSKFTISCYEDLLTAKIKAAQYYLSTTELTVHEISELCGYENDVCFMRLFKKRTGLTPSDYRKKVTV